MKTQVGTIRKFRKALQEIRDFNAFRHHRRVDILQRILDDPDRLGKTWTLRTKKSSASLVFETKAKQ